MESLKLRQESLSGRKFAEQSVKVLLFLPRINCHLRNSERSSCHCGSSSCNTSCHHRLSNAATSQRSLKSFLKTLSTKRNIKMCLSSDLDVANALIELKHATNARQILATTKSLALNLRQTFQQLLVTRTRKVSSLIVAKVMNAARLIKRIHGDTWMTKQTRKIKNLQQTITFLHDRSIFGFLSMQRTAPVPVSFEEKKKKKKKSQQTSVAFQICVLPEEGRAPTRCQREKQHQSFWRVRKKKNKTKQNKTNKSKQTNDHIA
jgi:hypothetical protein